MGGGQRTTTTYVRKGRHGIKGLAALGVSGKWCASAPLPLGWEFTRQLVDGGQSAAAQSQKVEPIGETLRISQVPVPGRSRFSPSVRRERDPSRGKLTTHAVAENQWTMLETSNYESFILVIYFGYLFHICFSPTILLPQRWLRNQLALALGTKIKYQGTCLACSDCC